jgi:hypothetical protein
LTAGIANILLELNRGAEAEAMLAGALAKACQAGVEGREHLWLAQEGHGPRLLEELAVVYHKTGRHADVVTLARPGAVLGSEGRGGA